MHCTFLYCRRSYTAVMCYIAQPEAEGEVRLWDARRVALSLPSVDDMLSDLSAVTAPNGESYSFVQTSVVNSFGLVQNSDDLFVLVCPLLFLRIPECSQVHRYIPLLSPSSPARRGFPHNNRLPQL